MSSSRNHLSSFRFIETLRVRSASQYRGFWFPSRLISFDYLKSLVSGLVFDSTPPPRSLKKGQPFFLRQTSRLHFRHFASLPYGRYGSASFRPLRRLLPTVVGGFVPCHREEVRPQHHVSILSRRLHCTAKELPALRAPKSAPTPTDPPSSPAVSIVTVLGGGLDPESPQA